MKKPKKPITEADIDRLMTAFYSKNPIYEALKKSMPRDIAGFTKLLLFDGRVFLYKTVETNPVIISEEAFHDVTRSAELKKP